MKLNFTFLKQWQYRFVFMLLLTAGSVSAQCPPNGQLLVNSQQQLNDFILQYPNCTELSALNLFGNNFTDMAPLSNLTTIGTISISATWLTTLSGLQNVTNATNIYIVGNSHLQNTLGLENVAVSDKVIFQSNPVLSSINMPAVTSVGVLDIKDCGQLQSLNGFSGITTIGELNISYCSLTSLAGLENVTSITDKLWIVANDQLFSLSGLQNDTLDSLNQLIIHNNFNLSICSQPAICSYLATDRYRSIGQNSVNCFNEAAIIASCTPVIPTTKISPDFCGAILNSSATAVYAVALQGATQYRFRISDGDTEQTIDKPSSAKYFRFNELGQYRYNIEYFVDVSAYINGSWTPYGDACTLTTPSTQIKPNQCGSTVATLTTGIYATSLPGTIMYRFRVTTPNTEFTIDKPTPVFTIADVPLHQYATTYTVDVAASVTDGIFGQYGPSCLVTSPAMPSPVIKASQCGSEVAFGSYIYADPFTSATGYRFSVTSSYGSQVLEKSVRYFSLNELSAYGYNANYAIQVSAFVNGQWTGYGPSCTVHTASNLPVTRLKQEYCNRIYPVFGLSLYAVIVPGATVYRFRVTNGAQVQILDRPANSMKLNMLSSYAYYTNYSIDVAVMIGGVWSDYGDTCNVNVIPKYVGPPARSTSSQDAKGGSMEISLAAYPNPSSDVFRLELGTQSEAIVTIQVYDLTGKLLDAIETSPEELSSRAFGDRYSAGIYNVIVTQDDYQKSIKLVKK